MMKYLNVAKLAEAVSGGASAIKLVDGVYPDSVKGAGDDLFALVRTENGKRLAAIGHGKAAASFSGEVIDGLKLCPLNPINAAALREVFPWTAPVPIGKRVSFGVGDRLGVATPGHLRCYKKYDIFPVLAQQSMREMGRTGRTAQDVIDDAGWGAFEAGWTMTFAADADHIKQVSEVVMCQKLGYTMFTIDSSDHIDLEAVKLSDADALARFKDLPDADAIKARYSGKSWSYEKGDLKIDIEFSDAEIARSALVYGKSIQHMATIYNELVAAAGGSTEGFDLEVSVDETEADTTVKDHFFWANELKTKGVQWQSLAPKFTGQFQKGIDYIGDKDKFEAQFRAHALLAEKLGPYKVSVHSGSDKFSIFPLVGKHTNGYFHLKTAGTSWLEAVRVIAVRAPGLYRAIHKYALANFEKDRQSYHVTTNLAAIPDVDSLDDSQLPALMDAVDPRQLLHITYGSLLSHKNDSGEYLYRDDIYSVLYKYEEDYYVNLDRHIGHHMETLGVSVRK